MARAKIVLCALIALASFGFAQAQLIGDTASAYGLLIYNVWVRPTTPAQTNSVTSEPPLPGTVSNAYMTIENTNPYDFKLIDVSNDIAEMTTLSEVSVNAKGLMQTHMIDSLDIPAGQTVTLDSNGYHAMLMNVTHDIYSGEAVPLTLTFAEGSATFDVQIAAIATDTPPADEPIIAANTYALPDGSLDFAVSLSLENRSDQADKLINISSSLGGKAVLAHVIETGFTPLDPNILNLPPHIIAMPGSSGFFIELSDLTQRPDDAFSLTLAFESGRQITVAVPVKSSGAGS